MKASELRTKNVDELNKELLDLLKAQFGLRMQIAVSYTHLTLPTNREV